MVPGTKNDYMERGPIQKKDIYFEFLCCVFANKKECKMSSALKSFLDEI